MIDAGISCRETERRMKKLDLSFSKVKAIFVSHEHADHITGVPGISKKYQLPVYITSSTHHMSKLPIADELIRDFDDTQPVAIGDLMIYAFSKSHDAVDPYSFLISCAGINVGVFTDIGSPCKQLIHYFKQCHAAFLESNYCETMLANGDYPIHLKRRISGSKGHLSNTQALDLFLRHRGRHLHHLILSHLSKNNNRPELVSRIFQEHAGSTHITVASRYEETAIYRIDGQAITLTAKLSDLPSSVQLSMF